jgi:hypothetical protein
MNRVGYSMNGLVNPAGVASFFLCSKIPSRLYRIRSMEEEKVQVVLRRSKQGGLGLGLIKSKPGGDVVAITVSAVDKGTPAAECGSIFVGDRLIEVNGRACAGRKFKDIMSQLGGASVRLAFARSPEKTTLQRATDELSQQTDPDSGSPLTKRASTSTAQRLQIDSLQRKLHASPSSPSRSPNTKRAKRKSVSDRRGSASPSTKSPKPAQTPPSPEGSFGPWGEDDDTIFSPSCLSPMSTSSSSGSPRPQATPEVEIQVLQRRLVAFFQEHEPRKVAGVARLMKAYRGRESELIQKVSSVSRILSAHPVRVCDRAHLTFCLRWRASTGARFPPLYRHAVAATRRRPLTPPDGRLAA